MRRSKLQVNISILRTLAQNGRSIPTHIVYDNFLNSSSVNECLTFLVEQNLVIELSGGKKRKAYDITDDGLKALNIAKQIDNFLHVFNVTDL